MSDSTETKIKASAALLVSVCVGMRTHTLLRVYAVNSVEEYYGLESPAVVAEALLGVAGRSRSANRNRIKALVLFSMGHVFCRFEADVANR